LEDFSKLLVEICAIRHGFDMIAAVPAWLSRHGLTLKVADKPQNDPKL